MLNDIKFLYTAVSSCVRINVFFYIERFGVTSGLRQAFRLSPLMLNIFIIDLALKLKACGKGVKLDADTVGILLYADDIVLLADNENELQDMLDILNNCCVSNNISANVTKSNVVHFRPYLISRANFRFTCGKSDLQIIDKYKYLGLALNLN